MSKRAVGLMICNEKDTLHTKYICFVYVLCIIGLVLARLETSYPGLMKQNSLAVACIDTK